MKHLVTVAAVYAASLFAAADVAAQQQPGRDACRADVERLCKDVQPGGSRIAQCLKDNEASVSAECKEHMAKMRERVHERMKAFDEACKGDVEQYCKDVQLGQGRMVRCLRDNEAKLSASCKEQMAKMDEWRRQMHDRMHGVAEACKGDAQQYCKDVRPGGGRLMRCLKDNEGKLSDACKAALQPQ
jgi:Golgi apparatus protein 1